jgi:hypothetical protein
MSQIGYCSIMQWHVRKRRHTKIIILDLQTYNEQKKLVVNKKKNQKTIQPHKVHFYSKIKKQEKKVRCLTLSSQTYLTFWALIQNQCKPYSRLAYLCSIFGGM